MDFNLMVANVRRAMSLDRSFYREVADDPRYSQEALMVVILAAALSGVGSFLTQLFGGNFFGSIIALMVGVVLAVVGYYIWAYVIQWLGATMFRGQGTAPELLRGLGFAYGPMALGIFTFIPCVGGLVAAVGAIWALVCGFFAVRETHKMSDGQTIVTVIVSWLVVAILTAIVWAVIGVVFGITAVGVNAVFGR